MKCPMCGGIGLTDLHTPNVGRCTKCNGIGKIEPTNEEWFCQLPTDEKAQWLENKMTWAAQEQGTFTAKGWEKWLKQPYTNKECTESMKSRKTIANDIRTMPDETLAEFLSVIDINKCDKEWWLNYLKKEI